uniref:cytoplasmic phosphatidylinositol transfer protein 1 n=1 Tax=Ciona intestinalis TaxID=7719 RepID=UPI000180D28C|nr:cytoplasmic phosphatidylinositol transfer protein 1 [Ciona intestinalis]|eukprot:XP_002128874.1 cytoplasmic phosphatidylinositol transfer protein 1 [Ciona intestinalis]
MLLKEYRICMPLSVEEYQRGQLYMINRHSNEQSESGEGVEVIKNEPVYTEENGDGQFTEKRIHLNNRLPNWARSFVPSIYVTEKAWNYYPYTITEYTCPWLPRLHIHIETRYENNNGHNNDFSCAKVSKEIDPKEFTKREVIHLDLAYDKVPDKHYKADEDCTKFKSIKTGRGPLKPNWRESHSPIMCSYKLVQVKFEVWGMQTKVESYIHKVVRDVLLLAHRQAFAWIDTWYDMTFDNIRRYESEIQEKTNAKVKSETSHFPSTPTSPTIPSVQLPGTSKTKAWGT